MDFLTRTLFSIENVQFGGNVITINIPFWALLVVIIIISAIALLIVFLTKKSSSKKAKSNKVIISKVVVSNQSAKNDDTKEKTTEKNETITATKSLTSSPASAPQHVMSKDDEFDFDFSEFISTDTKNITENKPMNYDQSAKTESTEQLEKTQASNYDNTEITKDENFDIPNINEKASEKIVLSINDEPLQYEQKFENIEQAISKSNLDNENDSNVNTTIANDVDLTTEIENDKQNLNILNYLEKDESLLENHKNMDISYYDYSEREFNSSKERQNTDKDVSMDLDKIFDNNIAQKELQIDDATKDENVDTLDINSELDISISSKETTNESISNAINTLDDEYEITVDISTTTVAKDATVVSHDTSIENLERDIENDEFDIIVKPTQNDENIEKGDAYKISDAQLRRIFGLGGGTDDKVVEQATPIVKEEIKEIPKEESKLDKSLSEMQEQLEKYNRTLKEAEEKAEELLRQAKIREDESKRQAEERIRLAQQEAEQRMELARKEMEEKELKERERIEKEAELRKKKLEEEAKLREKELKEREEREKRAIEAARIDAEEKRAAQDRKIALERAEALRIAAQIKEAEKVTKRAEDAKQLAFLDNVLSNINASGTGYYIIETMDQKADQKNVIFKLVTEDRELLYQSMPMMSIASAKSAINSFRRNATLGKFEIVQDEYFRFKLTNGSSIYYGPKYKSKESCEKYINLLKYHVEVAQVVIK